MEFTIIDFYKEGDTTPIDVVREFYGEDTVAEVYEQRAFCVTGRSTGSGNFFFVRYALLARRNEDIDIDDRGIHFRMAVLQPDMPFATQVVVVIHTWYRVGTTSRLPHRFKPHCTPVAINV